MDSAVVERSERLKTWMVVLLCLGGALWGGIALYRDRTAVGRAGQGSALAMLERREASVRRKPAGSYRWTTANLLEDLYRRDAIQTNADSSAVIRFTDNSVIEVGENSLVIVDDLKDIDLGSLRGSVVLRNAAGEGKKISVDSEGKAKVEEIRLRLSKPEQLARIFSTRDTREVEFAWQAPPKGGTGKYRLEVSSDRGFPIAHTRTVSSSDLTGKLSIASGRYFWRVTDGPSISSEVRQFRIAEVSALTPVYPAARDPISRFGSDDSVQFRWITPAELEPRAKHVLEIADDAAFTRNRLEITVHGQAGAATLEGIKAGHRFWRIRSQYGDVALSSATEEFTVAESSRLSLSPSFPEENARIELTRTALRFGWDSDAPEVARQQKVEYELEVQGADGKDVVTNKSVAQVYSWTQPKAGHYRWRVTALTGEKHVGQTAWRALTLGDGKPAQLLEPTDKQEVRYWTDPATFVFKWSADSLGAHEKLEYRLEVSKDPSFQQATSLAKTRETSLASDVAKLAPGTWYWRVSALDASGGVLRSSEPRLLVYGPYPQLPAPGVVSAPKVYNPLEDEKNPVVHWASVDGAQGYEVTFSQPNVHADGASTRAPASGGPVILKKTVSATQFEIPAKGLKPGQYEWQVRAIDKGKRLGETSPSERLEVTYGAPLDAPETTTEEVQ